MRNLTDRQSQVLECIRAYIRSHGYPPSRSEIAKSLGLTHASTIDWHLTALMRKGWVEIPPDTPRGIRLLKEDLPVVPIGRIAAGEPIVAESRIVDRMPMAVAERFSPRPDYFLTVQGDSMNRLGLNDGDTVAIKATPEAEDGQVVAARVENEVTLKRYRRIDDRCVELYPESTNEEHTPLRIDLANTEFHIDGIMVGALVGAE